VATKIKLLTVQNRRLEASRNREIKDLGDGFDGIFNEIKKEGSRNRAVLRQLSLAAEKGLGYASEQALLDFIRFDTIEDRQIAVREAHHKTFSWIFRGSASEGSQSDVNFADWLASESNIFWSKLFENTSSKILSENSKLTFKQFRVNQDRESQL
jgi:hypothetical protein